MIAPRRPAQVVHHAFPAHFSCSASVYEPSQVILSQPEAAVLVKLGRIAIPVQVSGAGTAVLNRADVVKRAPLSARPLIQSPRLLLAQRLGLTRRS